MHIKIKQKLFIYIFMVVLISVIDLITSAIIYNHFFVKYPILEISMIMLILSPIFLFKSNKFSYTYSTIVFAVLDIIMAVNLTLNYASNDVFSIKYIFLFSEAAAVMNSQFVNIAYVLIAILLALIFILYMVFIHRLFKYHFKDKEKDKVKARKYYPLAISLTVIFIAFGTVFRVIGLDRVKYDNASMYNGMSGNKIIEMEANTLKRGAIQNYGMLNYLNAEINLFISDNEKKEVEDYFKSGKIVNEEITDSLSGICKDMNVITIMIETGVDFAINEELTPNLYMLKNDGINFTNNHSKNKTNISEIIGIVGSVAKAGTTKDYNVVSTMPNMLNGLGYESAYFHNNSGSFYDRDKLTASMGFTKSYFKEDIDSTQEHDFIKGNYPLDSYFMNGIKAGNMNVLSDRMSDIDGIINKIVPDGNQKFYSFWTTMSTHGPYNTSKRNMKYYEDLGYVEKIKSAEAKGTWKNICSDDDIEYQNQIINFQCEMMDLDLAVGSMLERLEETNKLDNTLIVLYGDHEPYYMCNGMKPIKFAIYNDTNPFNPKLFSTTLIMHNKKLNEKYEELYGNTSYDKFSSPYNIVPTILDLLGVKYNQKYYVAKSAFLAEDSLDNVFYSHEFEALFSDKAYSFDLTNYAYKDEAVDDNYLGAFTTSAYLTSYKIKIFNRFYENKLYDYMK